MAVPRPPPDSFSLQCLRSICRIFKEAAKVTLVKGIAWNQLKCPSCMRSSTAAKWLCPCGLPWHQCKDHRRPWFSCGSKPLYRKAPKPKSANKAAPAALGSPEAMPPSSCSGLRPAVPPHKVAAAIRAMHSTSSQEHSSCSSSSHMLPHDIILFLRLMVLMQSMLVLHFLALRSKPVCPDCARNLPAPKSSALSLLLFLPCLLCPSVGALGIFIPCYFKS